MERLKQVWEYIKRFWKRKHITQILLLAALTALLLAILFFAYLAATANVQSLKDGLKQSTVLYDKDGDEAGKLAANRTGGAKIEELPDHMKEAVVSIEDERFYKHNGFDIKGIARAFFSNLFAGRITGGGSTITQQLAKNALLSPEQTYRRKAEEIFLAVEIEKNYKKEDILLMYLNQVYFGSGAWGIDRAARTYFNKPISGVTISEAALLAGLLQSPSALDPYQHYDRSISRRDTVLGKMQELGYISKDEYEKAIAEKIVLEDGSSNTEARKYPYYVDAVLDEATSKYGLTQEEIFTRGYTIYTELDQNIQSGLEKVYDRDSLFPAGRGGQLVQSGSVLLDPSTGGVRAIVGGRGEHVFRGFNRGTHIKAQPGSTLKPLSVYTPAIEEGYDASSILKDEPMTFGNYKPENFSRTYAGEVPMYKAVEESLNIPAVWLLNEIGIDKGMDSLKRFGIPTEKEDRALGIALGGMRKGISPLQLAQAYAAFPNEGKRHDAHFITKIVGPTGNVIAERKKKTVKVTSKAAAREMTSMLLNVVESGTGQRTRIPEVQIAGKTGSTQLPYNDIDGTKDQWFVGYTPSLVGAVWLGYDKTDREHYLSTSSSETVVPIFKSIMEQVLPYTEQKDFGTESVNDQLAEEAEPDIDLQERAEEFSKRLKEDLPEWKEKWQDARELLDKTEEKLNEIWDKIGS
ncbi:MULTISPECIES: transglycosylase domain-containing protein [Bacillaceae]|uniref:Penicillin-binding protein n=1 Tax=Bacillus infantis NRRL B-14911 TaxID=1367477 RepID=U5LCM1_9BACI|nr:MULTISPECIES: PBP1A family penicillin-binding protein [Bacillus]AGX04327.1 penicillin-binding protein [Bacillus infantis NRRL B-14911]EAR66972.1 penicillin-binding protein [Bacillus sp. NRRL B-14911]MCK6205263.1 PBP1A family penicillin-binding protein [Bacillus infantis]MDW2879008.1 PBP1A family penicillin-binding protein [Bacillus infantis]PLR74494.1 penicillin-binding protein [Bacillus sp. UMB0728]